MTNILANPKKLVALALILCLMFSMFPLQAAQAAPEDSIGLNAFEIKADGTISLAAETFAPDHGDGDAVYAVIFTKEQMDEWGDDPFVNGLTWDTDGSLGNFLAKGEIAVAEQGVANQAMTWYDGNSTLAANADYVLVLFSNSLSHSDTSNAVILPFTTKADKSYIYTDYAFSLAPKAGSNWPTNLTADGTTKEATRTYVLTNDGQKVLDDITISIDGADFSITSGGDTTSLAVGASAEITVKFSKASATAGTYTGTLKAVSTKVGGDAKAATAALSVQVKDVDPIYALVKDTTPTFTGITYGDTQPVAQNVTFKTTGSNQTENITAKLTGTGASAFTLTGTNNAVAAGGTATFSIQPKDKIKPGTYTVQVEATNGRSGAALKTATSDTITFVVAKKAVTLNADMTVAARDYNGSADVTAAGITKPTVNGAVAGGQAADIELDGKATYNSKDAGTDKTVTANFKLTAAAGEYYTLANGQATANNQVINKKTITAALDPASTATKVGTAANLNTLAVKFTGLVAGESISDGERTLTYALNNAGTTGITAITGTTTTAPTAAGTATFDATITLTGNADKNYKFAAGNSTTATATVTVAEGLFTIAYNANGGNGTINNQQAAVGENATLSDGASFTKDHAVLKGWNTNQAAATAGTVEFALSASANVGGTADATVTLYAVWAPTYTVTVNGTAMEDEYEAGATVTITAPAAEAGYTFKDWTVKAPATGVTLVDATQATTTFTMPAEAVEVEANYTAELVIDPVTEMSKKVSELEGLKVADFIAATTPTTEEALADLFDEEVTFTAGVATLNGVTIKVYKDDTYADVDDTLNGALTGEVGDEFYYTVEVTADQAGKPSENYTLKQLAAKQGVLTIRANATSIGGGSSSSGSKYYDVTYEVGRKGEISGKGNESVKANAYPTKTPKVTAKDGYEFKGWSLDGKTIVDPADVRIKEDTTFTAIFESTKQATLNSEDHIVYIRGYEDGTFAPNKSITRAEAITIFARLMNEKMDVDANYTNSFNDVKAGAWYANYIGYMEDYNIINGYEDGTFRPDAAITRAEFAAMASRFDKLENTDKNAFTDVAAGHWAINSINSAAAKGWINGYPDGTFRPNQYISRAEVVSIVNSMLGRKINADSIAGAEYKTFPDVANNHWAYYDVIEASNEHDYDKDETGKNTWKALAE